MRKHQLDETQAFAAALRASESWFRALIEKSWDHNFIISPDGTVVYSSPAINRTLGYSVEEFVGRNAFEFVHPDDVPIVSSLFSEILAEPGVSRSAEHRGRHKDGSWRWLEGIGTNLLDDPAIRGVVCNYRDSTHRKLAEEAVRESEHRFRELADAMPQIVWAARPDGQLDYFNRRWYEFTGALHGPEGDESWMPSLHPDDVQRCAERWYESVRTGKPYEIEYRFRDVRRGGYRWHLGRALPVRDDSGEVIRWFGTSTDIDDRKRAEAALQNADRRKDEFLAMLGHELRNPLSAIVNALHLLNLPNLDADESAEARAAMSRQCTNMGRLLDDLLDVARVTQGKIVLREQPLDLDDVVRRAVETVRPLIEARQHELTLRMPDRKVRVLGDSTRLEQTVTNLLHNAAKYTDSGGRIEVALEQEAQTAVVTVRDNGIGMTPEMLEHAFDLFTQADRSLDRSQGGLGIGLTMVKSIIDLHGGMVAAASAGLGRGSEFTIRLPVPPGVLPPDRLPVDRQPARPERDSRRVLVVEDNCDAADTLSSLLQHWGYCVRTAYDGADALLAERDFQPDAVLLDIGLPGIDGYEVARRLRSAAGAKHLLIVAISGYGREEDKRRAREAGCDYHLTKPPPKQELESLLSALSVDR